MLHLPPQPASTPPRYSAFTRIRVAERLLVAGLRADERADESDVARRRLAFLFKASQQLATSLDPATVLQVLVEQVVPEFGDAAVVHTPKNARQSHQIRVATCGALRACSPEWWERVERAIRGGVRQAIRLGQSEIGSKKQRRAPTAPLDKVDLTYLIVPLQARGRRLGALTILGLAPRRSFGHADLATAEALGDQAGLALDNAQLHEAQRTMLQQLDDKHATQDRTQGESLRDDERRRIARELHDHVEQTFFSIGLTTAVALQDGQADAAAQPLVDGLMRAGELSKMGAEQLRAAIFGLTHAELAGQALTAALWKLVRAFQQRTGIDTDLVLTGSEYQVAPETAEALFATAREALANVERHAQAEAVVLGLRVTRRFITLTVQDDGIGASNLVLKRIGSSATHFGLRGLRERVRRLHGSFTSGPGPDGGFVVRARIPLQSGATT
jgi:signal transduction histidine kinase